MVSPKPVVIISPFFKTLTTEVIELLMVILSSISGLNGKSGGKLIPKFISITFV